MLVRRMLEVNMARSASDKNLEIVEMLNAWGRWQRSRSGNIWRCQGLISSYREREDHGTGLVIARDPDSEELDKLICVMGQKMGMFYQHALVSRYVYDESIRQLAIDQKCSEALMKVRLQTAHAWLGGVVFGVRLRILAEAC